MTTITKVRAARLLVGRTIVGVTIQRIDNRPAHPGPVHAVTRLELDDGSVVRVAVAEGPTEHSVELIHQRPTSAAKTSKS